MHRAYWKSLVILAVALLAAWTLFPSFSFYRQPRTQQEEMRQRRNPLVNKILNLGLDLPGIFDAKKPAAAVKATSSTERMLVTVRWCRR